ncbi:MAG: formylglycine-generating enzyme family protein [Pseudomonadota bacterium]
MRKPEVQRSGLTVMLVLAAAHVIAADRAPAGAPLEVNQPVGLRLPWIPGGAFDMGDSRGEGQSDEVPVRQVELQGFWMMASEVTVAMFERFVIETDYRTDSTCWVFVQGWQPREGLDWRSPGFEQGLRHPVTCVNWEDATAFARWLSLGTGLEFSLPSEAEWEYAARSGDGRRYAHGDDEAQLCAHANGADISALRDYPGFDVNRCDDGYTRTAPVGSYPANAWGLHDMTGNVWEWVQDCWVPSYEGASTEGDARQEGDCERRAYRGGAYGDIPAFLRLTLRNRGRAKERRDDIGFRLVVRPGASR